MQSLATTSGAWDTLTLTTAQCLQALQQIAASSSRSTLEWHLDQQDSGYVGMLCLDHIALPPQPRPHHLLTSQIDFQDETSTDDDMEVSI